MLLVICFSAEAQQLNSIFPPGAQAGTSTSVVFAGGGLEKLSAARCNHPGVTFAKGEGNSFTVHIVPDTPPGLYDVQTIGSNGVSSARTFFVSKRNHIVEAEPKDSEATQAVPLDCVISGRIAKGDIDEFRFKAVKGDKVVIECWADRIDSSLRAMLELRDANGKRLAVNRGFFGVDPVITFAIPSDGDYIVQLHDLVYSGGDSHFYRLDIGTGPRVVFAVPPVVERGKDAQVTLYGWNLNVHFTEKVAAVGPEANINTESLGSQSSPPRAPLQPEELGKPLSFESMIVRLKAPATRAIPAVHRRPASLAVDAFAHYYGSADVPTVLGIAAIPVALGADNNSANAAQVVNVPTEVAGQLTASDERDWYAIDARRGEVFYFEAFGERIDSPVDLDLSVLDSTGDIEIAAFHDEVRNVGGLRFPSAHLDPEGRWVAPADGRYLVTIRNLIGGIADDPRRVYRLSIRREEADVQLVAIAQAGSPAGINLQRGGRTVVDVLAFQRRGLTGSVRVSARNLPAGITCPDIWLGPDVTTAPLVLTADRDVDEIVTTLDLIGQFDSGGGDAIRDVQGGTMIRSGLPTGSGRLTPELPVAIAGDAGIQITANGHEIRDHHLYGKLKVRHSPGGVLDVAVRVDRREAGHAAPVKLVGVGLPEMIHNQTASIPAGDNKGYISFYLPHSLAVGTYTLAIRADTTVPIPGQNKAQNVTIHSNAVTFEVHPPAFRLDLDLSAPRKIKRGEIVKVGYTTRRINGFISKIHTELAAPGKVTDVGRLRGRGVTSVGQTESGTIQIIANEDAELGTQPFLRLYGVGVLEDEAVYHGSCFLPLEIIE
ncbi:MAG: hypothetical protein CMJ64_17025 [Planctomycetaceae bacterium]|nr:hypothetical protein [Planctomycetaceae bacterium]